MTDRDRWAEWLLERRHGGDPERLQEMVSHLTGVRDGVLDRADLAAGDTVLDVGCGDGLIAFGALDRVGPEGKVIFSDVSTDLLDVCRQHAVETGVVDRCDFVQASADRLDAVADESVEAVTTRSVLIYIGDKLACFDEFHRVLRTGGRLSVFEPINGYPLWDADDTYCGYDVRPVADLFAKLTAMYDRIQPRTADPMSDFDERDLLRMAEQSGFHEIHLELRVDIEPRLPPSTWDGFINSAPNPLVPSHAEAWEATLSADEVKRIGTHLRPLVESGTGRHRLAIAHLWATKQ